MAVAITFVGVKKSYGDVVALEDVSLPSLLEPEVVELFAGEVFVDGVVGGVGGAAQGPLDVESTGCICSS